MEIKLAIFQKTKETMWIPRALVLKATVDGWSAESLSELAYNIERTLNEHMPSIRAHISVEVTIA
jgi:hypothetical protein